ncbi:MAG: DUF4157 domain-containing protein [Solirubrobacteraceae bacterium]
MIRPDLQRSGGGILEGGRVHPDVTARIAASRGRGAELDPALSAQASSTLGDAFADVRVHTDALSDSLARSVQARAFTTGADIYFASGEYRPESPSGRQLIAHELAHVVQQRGAPVTGDMVVSQPGDVLELQAEQAARLA